MTGGSSPGPAGAADGTGTDRILVLARSVPVGNRSYRDRRLAQLLDDLAAVVAGGRLMLLASDSGHGRHGGDRFRPLGVEVVAGGGDAEAWLEGRPLLFSHVVATDLPGLRRLDEVLRRTQPQATRILCLPALDLYEPTLSPAEAEAGETAGATLAARRVEDQVRLAAERSHAIWCATEADQAWLGAVAPDRPVAVVPTAAEGGGGGAFEERSGYVVLAAPGADVSAGHDDAALHAGRELLPALLRRDPTAFVRVVVDEPSPALQLLAGPHLELVPAGDDPARWFRRSRVCLAWYPRGNGSRLALTLALDARTPFVTSAQCLRDAGLGRLTGPAGADDPEAACLLAERLHARARLWSEVHAELEELAEGSRSPATARLRLLRACAAAGIAPRPDLPLEHPVRPAPVAAEPPLRPRAVPVVGSAWKAAPPAPDEALPDLPPPDPEGHWLDVPVEEQYERWCARYGPTRLRLDRLARRLRGLVRRPRISVLMPVFNTDPSWLHDAVSSVRSQVYENWELCIADDGSVDQRTIDMLETHRREDDRIRVTRLPSQQGIAAATNAALALATGEFAGLLDHDDELKPHALGEVALAIDGEPDVDLIYSDEDKRDPDGRLVDPFFKPDWSPDHLMSRNYVCHFLVMRRGLLEKLGGFRLGYDGSQDYDLVLRATELTDRIAHVAEPLYTWRKIEGSTAGSGDAKPWALEAARRALQDALERRGTPGEVVAGLYPGTYRVRYALRGRPRVSILIPTRDRVDLLRRCVESITGRSTYSNYELVVVDNGSTDAETLAYLAAFPGRVVRYPHLFNYPRMMNLAAAEATGDLLLFLNNDTEVVTPGWLEALVEHGQRDEVGAVSARLLYPDGQPQHEGTIVGYKGAIAGNVDHRGYGGMGEIVRNCSAVTGACMLVRPSVYWEVGGHDERLRVAYNDVDLCLRIRQAGYQIVYTPHAELLHVEGGTRGVHAHADDDDLFESHWVTHKCIDPYYSPNLERLYPFRIRA